MIKCFSSPFATSNSWQGVNASSDDSSRIRSLRCFSPKKKKKRAVPPSLSLLTCAIVRFNIPLAYSVSSALHTTDLRHPVHRVCFLRNPVRRRGKTFRNYCFLVHRLCRLPSSSWLAVANKALARFRCSSGEPLVCVAGCLAFLPNDWGRARWSRN